MSGRIEDPLIGVMLANFRVEHIIGRGGMALVYYGQDVKLRRPVAIKVIDARYRDKPSYAERFLREARAVATWRHENITQVYYADDEDGLYYYVMEYIDGMDLDELLNQYEEDGELMPAADVLNVGRSIAAALDYAHSMGVIHRDIKPSNIMVERSGRVLLADFGLAMDVSQGSLGEVFGSPHYMSPEQARHSASAVPQSDLYSLGVILYEMLTGCTPFDDPSPATLALQHITQAPPSPRTHNPSLSEATETVLLKALHKLPSERYQTGAALMTALTAALEKAPRAAAAPAGSTARPPRTIDNEVTLPPPPAMPPANNGPRTSSITVAERVALHLVSEARQPASAAAFHALAQRQKRRRNILLLSIALVLFALLAVGISSLGDDDAASPTAAGIAVLIDTASPSATLGPMPTASRVPLTRPPAVVINPATETPRPTATTPPTATTMPTTAAPTPFPTATILFPDGLLLRMVYNDSGFYLINLTGARLDIRRIAFETLDAGGFPTVFSFQGRDWGYPFVFDNNCNRIELFRPGTSPSRPAICETFNAWLEAVDADGSQAFWLPHGDHAIFRIIWDEGEIGQCQMRDRRCDVYLPRDTS